MEDLLMVKQTGSEYREKNRIRLQRFYERQAASGKRRISALVSDETHGHLMAEKDRTGMSISEIIEAALNQRYDPQEDTQSRESSVGHDGIPDVDDVSEDYLTAYTGPDPEPSSGETQESADTTQGDDTPDTDQGMDTGPDLVEPVTLDELVDVIGKADDITTPDQKPAPQGDDLIPEWTHPEVTKETAKAEQKKIQDERDRILVQVSELLPERKDSQARADLLNQKGVPVSLKPGQYGGEWTKKQFTDNLRHAKKRLGIK
jgi:hypothetical protein